MLRIEGRDRPERAVPPKRKADDEVYGSAHDTYVEQYAKCEAPMRKKSSSTKLPHIFSFKKADEIQERDYLKTPTEDLYSPMETTEMHVDELPYFGAPAAASGILFDEEDDPELVSLMSRVGRMSVVPAEEDDEDLRLVDALLDRPMDRASCSLVKQLKILGQRSLSAIPDEEISLSGDGFGGESPDMDCAL